MAMTPERWAEVNDVLQRAMQLAPENRPAFLDSACASDPPLRREVDSLLAAADDVRSSFLESALKAELPRGSRLGDYEVVALLGAGGMGEVYRARDLRLRRVVAIKVLPAFVSSDPERLRRFEQEALAAAALNHPNILAVFQMGTHEGAPYLVSELLEGETLREQLKRAPLPSRKTINCGVQIAHGLAAAHEKGIVHRDLKPENLFVTKDGRVKILDFGLAKLTQAQGSSANSALTVGSQTEPGMVMGTAGYMSPEQVRGQSADHRADIFAFGAILYEMLTGQRAFQKPTSAETMTAVLLEEPAAIPQIAPQTPPALQRIVQRCLEKNPDQRFQSASDLAFALDALSDSGALNATGIAQAVHTSRRSRYTRIAAASVIALIIAASAYIHWHRGPAKLKEKGTVILADFDNKTGDPIFDDTLKQALAAALRQSPFLSVLSDSRVNATLQFMKRPSSTPLNAQITQEICQRANGKAWIGGSIASIGGQYLVGLKAFNCQTGDVLADEQATAGGKEQVLDVLNKETVKLRTQLGESLADVKKFDVPLRQATTSSLEALKALSVGSKTLHEKGPTDALPFYEHAIELDPDFATAYMYAGKMHVGLYEYVRAKELFSKAYSLRGHASEIERFDIESMYYEFVVGDLENSIRVYREWLSTYPDDFVALGNLAHVYSSMGQCQQAADLNAQSLKQAPSNVTGYDNYAWDLMCLNRFGEARGVIHNALDSNLDSYFLHSELYWLAFLTHDDRGIAEQAARSKDRPILLQEILALQAGAEAFFGHLQKSRELSQQAVDAWRRTGAEQPAAVEAMHAALRDASFGNLTQARERAIASLNRSNTADNVQQLAALALASAGDALRAQSLLNSLVKEYPKGTLINFVVAPTVQARLELSKGNAEKSIQLLQSASIYELSEDTFAGCLYPIYVRGQAYLALKDGASAAAEFQRILDHSGIVKTCETGALASLGLARAYALQGNTPKAKTAYQDFLTLWKDADPDIPILNEAKSEYAMLTRTNSR